MEASASIIAAKHLLLVFGAILLGGTLAAWLAQKLRVPDVVLFLLTGILLGPLLGWVDIRADSALNQLIVIFGACYILFDGGATLRLGVLKQVWITIVSISTLGLLITIAVTGLAAHLIFGVPWPIALLLAATIGSTDPATLVPVFRQVKIKERVAQTVMSESAFNDAVGAIATFSILGVAMGGTDFSLGHALGELAWEASVGIVAGAVLGYLAAWMIAHQRYAFLAEYAPVVSLVAVLAAYLGADGLSASGFMAVFVFGIMLGNKELFGMRMEQEEAQKFEDFVLTTAFVLRLFIFILLGTQVDFGAMQQYAWGGVLLVTVFMLVARPLTVLLSAAPDRRARWTWRELLFMCWTRETGVIPGALAAMLVGLHAPGAELIAAVTFIAILMTIVIQATTTRWLAGKLDLLVE